jgi:predicted dehydrogenase
MNTSKYTRRRFLQTSSAATAAGLVTPYFLSAAAADDLPRSKNDRHVIGCIGTGSRWGQIVGAAMNYGDVVAVCDVDRNHAEKAREKVGGKAKIHEDYRKLLDDKSIDTVLIVTPDHWHTKPCIDAMRAGKDIYCEKPLTLTIDEGKKIIKVLDQTQRVFQVGTQQRTEMNGRFITAVALARSGRLGKIQKITCAIGAAPTGGPFPVEPVPEGLHWDMWLGQAPLVEYRRRRCHYEFRWWYEYSGGKMTDWGAHHVDIAHWALGADDTGPISVEGTATHPVPLKGGYPTADDSYNTATEFFISCKFADGAEVAARCGERRWTS